MSLSLSPTASSSSSSSAGPSPLRVTLVGAGNLSHVFAGLLGAQTDRYKVSVLSRKADAIRKHMTEQGVRVRVVSPSGTPSLDTFVTGKVERVSSRASEVIPGADVVLMTVPSHARPQVLREIAPYLPKSAANGKQTLLGVMPGMGGFDYIARDIVQKQLGGEKQAQHISIFALKDVPYMCTATVPGESVTLLGPKTGLYLALADYDARKADHAKRIVQEISGGIPTVILDTFLTITLTPGNPIMHPSIMYGAFGPYSQWDGKPLKEKPLFYEDCSELSAYFLSKADAEIQVIRKGIEQKTGLDLEAVWPLRLNLKKVYGPIVEDNRTLLLAMTTNKAYKTIRTPLKEVTTVDGQKGFTVDVSHRFFLEDVPFGLVVLHDIGVNLLGVETRMIDELILWSQGLMKKEYLDVKTHKLTGKHRNETGAPSVWGIRSIEQLARGAKRPSKL